MPDRRNALIWSLESPGVEHVSYVMGTMHVKDQRAYKAFEQAQKLLDHVEQYYSEVDLDELQMEGSLFSTMLPDGKSLRSLLGSKYGKVRKIVQKAFGLDVEFFNLQMPIVLVNFISETVLSADQEFSLDLGLWQLAQSKGIKTGGIETVEEHFTTLQSISLDQQVKMLLGMSRDVRKFRQKILQLAELYTQGSIHRLYMISKKELGGLKGTMLYHRNEKMASRLLEHHSKAASFLAIGAGHLSGEKGVLHLLNQTGGTISPLL